MQTSRVSHSLLRRSGSEFGSFALAKACNIIWSFRQSHALGDGDAANSNIVERTGHSAST